MSNKRTKSVAAALMLFLPMAGASVHAAISPLEQLGELLFFDARLSEPNGQSCASCHAPAAAFADPNQSLPVSVGVLPANRFGNRNAPSAAYAMFSPEFYYDSEEGLYMGGQFWDGRAANLVEQAKGPFLNPLEMNNPSKRTVILDILTGPYATAFVAEFGHDAAYIRAHIDEAYDFVAGAIAAFEMTEPFRQFNSKYDYYLAGNEILDEQELRGLALFEDEAKGNCAACHPSRPAADGTPPMFTDFTYDNLGVPKNPENPFYSLPKKFNPDGDAWVDHGLGGVLGLDEENGKHKVMTLRNIAVTAPYLHNGVFATLREVVEFYNARDLGGFDPPEVAENVNTDELGNLGLTDPEIDDIVAFLLTLSDGYELPIAAKSATAQRPTTASLLRNYPNPFNPSTTIAFTLSHKSRVQLTVFNILGQAVAKLIDKTLEPGEHTASWDASNGSSGVYLYRLATDEFVETRRMILLK
jgi:cytochrome c peroxidase